MQKKNQLNLSHESQFSAIKQDRQIYKDFDWQDLKNYFQGIKFDENEKWDLFIKSSNSLCEKRLAIREKKVIELGSEIKGQFKIEVFLGKWKHGMPEDEFEIWLSQQTPLTLLEFYVDHQEILEVSTKNSLNRIIGKKLEFEKKFLDFKNMQHNFFYWYSATALSFAIFLGMVGGVVVSAGLTSALFLSLAVSSLVIKLSFWLANYLLNSRHKGHSSGLLNFRIGIRQLKYEISNYWLKVKEKELTEKSMEDYLALEKKTDDLLTDVESLKELRRKNEAEDFYKFAQLDASAKFFKDSDFVVNVLIEAFKELDFDLISPELKDLIQIELGIDTVKLEKELNVEEQNSALSILRKDFMKFFTLDDAAYTKFMKYQTARIEAGNLKVCALRTSSI